MKKLTFKKDRFSKNRGDYSRWLLISCEHCNAPLVVYQKDGPGALMRLYFDRIVLPKAIAAQKPSTTPDLRCKTCNRVVGIPTIFKKEKRAVFRLFAGAVTKRVISVDGISRFEDKLKSNIK